MEATFVATVNHAGSGEAAPDFLPLELTVTDPEAIVELLTRTEGRDRDEYALSALRLGLLALRQARGQVDSVALRVEGDHLLSSVQSALRDHRSFLAESLTKTLGDYFDPRSGRFTERVERLVKKDGELESLLSRNLTGEQSELARTLATFVGKDSPLFRMLAPDEAQGLLAALKSAVTAELEVQRDRVLVEFSLDNKEGALSRLVTELTDRDGRLKTDLTDKIDEVVKEFSLNDEGSALSRLVRQVDRAQRTISAEFSLDNTESALSRMKRELLEVLDCHEKRDRDFQEQVRVTLATMQARRGEADLSTRHGLHFEEAVFAIVQSLCQYSGDTATSSGATVGLIKNCKKGDVVVELAAECVAAGAKVVVEAKEDASYNLAAARAEIEIARKNRGAQAGLFVFSHKCAPQGLDPLARYGDDLIVIWNAEDAATDVYLKVGLSVAKALCTRTAIERAGHAVDFTPIDQAILEIQKQIEELDKIRVWTEQIRSHGDGILDRLRISREKLGRQASLLQQQVEVLKQNLIVT